MEKSNLRTRRSRKDSRHAFGADQADRSQAAS
jgi:hypothetical protein